jgi:LytS/YehU family sensor histidine kinase
MGAFTIALGLITILFIRQNKIRADHRNVLLEQKMLRLQMNPHFIFNALSGILEFIDNKLNETASKYLSTFASLMRSTLESTRKEFIYLEEEVTWLKNYMELQKLRYANNFQFSIKVDDKLDPTDVKIPPMLIQPFVENAIEHGIRHKNAPGNISVNFSLKNKLIQCEVEDDGVGREKAWEIEHKTRKVHKPMATDIVMDRLRAINKKMKYKIRLDILDIKSDKNEPIGTRVVLDMPYV